MSSIVGSITGGGGKGMAFDAKGAEIENPVSKEQINQAYLNTQTGLGNQKDFLNAVNAQNGLGNQTSVFNQLQGVANGTGPNPAQAQLANATGANVSNQAALMAGQRGAGANAGMMARQAAQVGGNIQQNAAGQAAQLQAQQSLGALNQMGGIATNQANQQANATNAFANTALGQQQNLLGAQGAYNNSLVAMQSNMNNANAQVNGAIVPAQGNMMQGIMGAAGSVMNLIGGDKGKGDNPLGGTSSDFGFGSFDSGGGVLTDGGNIADVASIAAQGGMVKDAPKMAIGGEIPGGTTELAPVVPMGPQSSVGKSFMEQQQTPVQDPMLAQQQLNPNLNIKAKQAAGPDMEETGQQMLDMVSTGVRTVLPIAGQVVGSIYGGPVGGMAGKEAGKGIADFIPDPQERKMDEAKKANAEAAKKKANYKPGTLKYAEGGQVDAILSPGEKYLDPKAVSEVAKGASPMAKGKEVPGKAKVAGAVDSYSNDTVPAKVHPGGIVLPRSVTQADDADRKAQEFVQAVLAKQGLKKRLK